MRYPALLLPLLTCWACTVANAQPAPGRVALVIGNGKYEHAPLPNPPNDARAVEQALKACGFQVECRTDCGRKELRRAIQDFGRRLGPGTEGVFYYAGHGMQIGGDNYLIPVGADIQSEEDVLDEAVNVRTVLENMATAGSRVNILILDACRGNPFRGSYRGTTRGLARMSAPAATLLWYSAQPGSEAPDGNGATSPFTNALVHRMLTPGLPVELVFKQIAKDLRADTAGGHAPWQEGVLAGDFCFLGSVAPDARASLVPSPAPGPRTNWRRWFLGAGLAAGAGVYYYQHQQSDPGSSAPGTIVIDVPWR